MDPIIARSEMHMARSAVTTAKMTTKFVATNYADLIDAFAGREGYKHYDSSKKYTIAPENRAFVWDDGRIADWIKTIIKGRGLGCVVVCDDMLVDGGNRITAGWLFATGQKKVEIDGVPMDFTEFMSNPEYSRKWFKVQIGVEENYNVTAKERSEIFVERNNAFGVTNGHFFWNFSYTRAVQYAHALLGRRGAVTPPEEVVSQITNDIGSLKKDLATVWKGFNKTSKTNSELGKVIALMLGSQLGPLYYHDKFHQHHEWIVNDANVIDLKNLKVIIDMIKSIPAEGAKKQKRTQFFEKFIGAIIHDFHNLREDRTSWERKWTTFGKLQFTTLTKGELETIRNTGSKRASGLTNNETVAWKVQQQLDGIAITPAATDSDAESDVFSDDESDE